MWPPPEGGSCYPGSILVREQGGGVCEQRPTSPVDVRAPHEYEYTRQKVCSTTQFQPQILPLSTGNADTRRRPIVKHMLRSRIETPC